MQIISEKEIDFKYYNVSKFDRPQDFLDTIQKHYVGKTESIIGNNYCSFKNGKLVNFCHGRSDVILVQFTKVANCFIEPNGFISIDCWSGVQLLPDERAKIESICKEIAEKEKNYMASQRQWHSNYQWISIKLDGKSPEEAVEILKEWMQLVEASNSL